MSSVAKCLVLAGVALEADALLLQTGTTVTECKQHGCSGDSKDSGNDICKLYTKVADMTDEQKTALKDEKVEKGTKKDTVKFDGVEYTCAKADCAQDKKKPDDKKSTEPKDVDAKLGKEGKTLVKKGCDDSNAEAPAEGEPDGEVPTEGGDMCLLKMQVGKLGKKNKIEKVEKKSGGDKSIEITFTGDVKKTYTCGDNKKCDETTGTTGSKDNTVGPKQVDAAAPKGADKDAIFNACK